MAGKSNRIFCWVAISGWLIMASGCTQTPIRPTVLTLHDYTYFKKHLSWLIEKEMREHQVKGLSIGLVDDQKIIWAKGFGYADEKTGKLAGPETVFKIGSVSKVITAVGLMQLVEQNQIELDNPIKTYLPDFNVINNYSNPITVRSLMTHHSGLPAGDMFLKNQDKNKSLETILDDLKNIHASFPVNYIYSYSNLAVELLGLLLQSRSKTDFNDYMQANIFEPLHMSDTSYFKNEHIKEKLAQGYDHGKPQTEEFWDRVVPSGSIYSTIHDMCKFIKMIHAGGRNGDDVILKQDSLREMFTPQNLQVKLDLDYHLGLNWFLSWPNLDYAGKVVWHTGGTRYFHSILAIMPKQKLGVIVLSNSSTGAVINRKIAEATLQLAHEIKTGKTPPPTKLKKPAGIKLSPGELEKYTGEYTVMDSGHVKIINKNNRLQCRIRNKKLNLVAHPEGLFSLQFNVLGIFPYVINNYQIGIKEWNNEIYIYHLDQKEGNKAIIGKKINKVHISDAWKKRLGKYKCLDKTYSAFQPELAMRNGFLLWNNQPLLPQDDTTAVIPGFERNYGGQTIKVATQNGAETILYLGLTYKKSVASHAEKNRK
ncbi:beta-lactamase family protein [bacterium]|nr:beta-lactamase family protein [bacterium]